MLRIGKKRFENTNHSIEINWNGVLKYVYMKNVVCYQKIMFDNIESFDIKCKK